MSFVGIDIGRLGIIHMASNLIGNLVAVNNFDYYVSDGIEALITFINLKNIRIFF